MKMNPQLVLNQLKELELGDIQKIWKKDFNRLKLQCNSPETATQFYLDIGHKLKDQKRTMFIAFGKQKPDWKKHVKTDVKQRKKESMTGFAYVETKEDGSFALCLMPKIGNPKISIINKFSKKLLKKHKISEVKIVEGTTPITDDVDQNQEEMERPSMAGASTAKGRGKEKEPKSVSVELGMIAKDYLGAFQVVRVLMKKKPSSYTEDQIAMVKKVVDLGNQFLEAYPKASDKHQQKLGKMKGKIEAALPQLGAFLTKIQGQRKVGTDQPKGDERDPFFKIFSDYQTMIKVIAKDQINKKIKANTASKDEFKLVLRAKNAVDLFNQNYAKASEDLKKAHESKKLRMDKNKVALEKMLANVPDSAVEDEFNDLIQQINTLLGQNDLANLQISLNPQTV